LFLCFEAIFPGGRSFANHLVCDGLDSAVRLWADRQIRTPAPETKSRARREAALSVVGGLPLEEKQQLSQIG